MDDDLRLRPKRFGRAACLRWPTISWPSLPEGDAKARMGAGVGLAGALRNITFLAVLRDWAV